MAYPTDWMPTPDLYAFTSAKKARKFARKKFGVELESWTTEGRTTSLQNGHHLVCIVVIEAPGDSIGQRASLLAHECVHVAQKWAELMGDTEPSDEWFAYAVQAANLTCIEQLGEKWLQGNE